MPEISCDLKYKLPFHPGDKYFPAIYFYIQSDGKLAAICNYCDGNKYYSDNSYTRISKEEYLKRLKLQAFK